jgi:hypothetical protein
MSCALVSGLLCGAGVSWAAESARATSASPALVASEYRRVTFNELIANELKNPIHLSFEIPKGYVHRVLPNDSGSHLWGMASELDHLVADPEHSISRSVRGGLIVAEVSTSVGYDERARKFSVEDEIKRQLLAAGATNVVVLRRDAGRYPILAVTARLQGKWMRSVYVGLLVDTLASFINFREPGDIQVWEHFVTSAKAE